MEKERKIVSPKLVERVAWDFPSTSGVRVSFPDQWEHVETVKTAQSPIYIGAFPIERTRSRRDEFYGLAPEINVSLVFYRLYKFFQPWPTSRLSVGWNEFAGRGRVERVSPGPIHLHPVGQAQAWFGVEHAVLWECFLEDGQRQDHWQELLGKLWQVVEQDVRSPKILTLPHEPAFQGDYTSFLQQLGYAEDQESIGWWSKTLGKDED